MTFTEFLQKIDELNIPFHIREVSTRERGTLRMVRDDEGQCPICAVCNRMFPMANYANSAWWNAGERIGLSVEIMNDIVAAADDEPMAPMYINDIYMSIRALIGEK